MKNDYTLKRDNRKRTLLFFLILPFFVSVIAPFIMILRVALKPEGLAAVKNKELKIWDSNNFNYSDWIINKASIINKNESGCLTADINIEQEGSWAKFRIPFHQNLYNFKYFLIDIDTNINSFLIGLEDIYGHESAKAASIKKINGFYRLKIYPKDFKLKEVDSENLKHFYLKFTIQGNYYLKIKDITAVYKSFTLTNFKKVLLTSYFGKYFFNSFFTSFFIMLGNIIFCTMAGFAFAWKKFPFQKTLYIATLAVIMIPMHVFMIPIFVIILRLGWLNTYKALIIPFLITPINIFIMKQYISKIPRDFVEAALIDGASYYHVFFKIIFPICKPAVSVIAINTFVNSWNSFLYPFILTTNVEMRTLPVGLALYTGLFDVDWAHLMTASSISALPVMIIFLFSQKYIIAGMLSGTAYQS